MCHTYSQLLSLIVITMPVIPHFMPIKYVLMFCVYFSVKLTTVIKRVCTHEHFFWPLRHSIVRRYRRDAFMVPAVNSQM